MEMIKPTYEDLENRILELEATIGKVESGKIISSSKDDSNTGNLIKKIVTVTPNIFVIKDLNSVYIEANNSFCDFLGRTKDEIIGKTDFEFFPKEEAIKYIEEDKKVLQGEISKNNEWEVEGGTESKWLKVLKTPIFDDNEKPIGVLCSVTDISEQKKVELALIDSEKKLLELNALKDKFFSIIGHDLRTPISNILGFNQLLLENIENYNQEKIEGFLKVIQASANKSFSLLSDLLEWSRSQSGKIQVYKESINLKKVILKALDLSSENIKGKKLNVSVHCNEELFVVSDTYILSAVFRNLISNAVKFSNEGSKINIECSEVVSDKNEKGYKITVEDEGIGMSSEVLKSLFKINKTVSVKGTEGELGTGLGLILSKEFLDKIGGTINVESELGKGSKFEINL